MPLRAAWFLPHVQRGGYGTIRTRNAAKPLSSISLIPLWLSPVNRPSRFRRERKAGTRATPPKSGGACDPDSGTERRTSIPVPWGRSRPHLSLREGSEKPPFSLALHRVGSVLAVKGSLRRFAPWTAPGRSERRAAYEGKGGVRAVGREGELAHDKGYYHSYCRGGTARSAGWGDCQAHTAPRWISCTNFSNSPPDALIASSIRLIGANSRMRC